MSFGFSFENFSGVNRAVPESPGTGQLLYPWTCWSPSSVPYLVHCHLAEMVKGKQTQYSWRRFVIALCSCLVRIYGLCFIPNQTFLSFLCQGFLTATNINAGVSIILSAVVAHFPLWHRLHVSLMFYLCRRAFPHSQFPEISCWVVALSWWISLGDVSISKHHWQSLGDAWAQSRLCQCEVPRALG